MIEVKNVSKIYGKHDTSFAALKNVSFNISNGSPVAIIGKSGSGKSTLMHIMSSLDKPNEGSVTIDGQVINKLKKRAADNFRARDVGFIFQSFFVEARQTCYQNVALPLEINDVGRKERDERIKQALEQVGLTDKTNQKARNLSGGQQQRLSIARSIVTSPKLIFADEPTGNLDSVTGESIINLLFELNQKRGISLIITTHDLELARRCQMQIILKDGEVMSINDSTPKKTRNTRNSRVRSELLNAAIPAPSGNKTAKAAINNPLNRSATRGRQL